MPAHRDLLARRLGVPVEDADPWSVAAQLIEKVVHRAERVVGGRHERAPDRVDDQDVLDHDEAASGIAGREVDGPDRERQELDVVEELPLVPHVVAVRNDIRSVRISSRAISSVSPAPPAEFSPLTMAKSIPWSFLIFGSSAWTAVRPGLPTTSPTK